MVREWFRRIRYIATIRRREAELAEEMAFHASMTDAAAFGNRTIALEDSRAVWIWPWLESLWQDAAYAARNIRRQPGFTIVVVSVLGTVIGLHATLVTLVAGIVFRPWPGIRDPAQVAPIFFWDQAGGPQPDGLSLADARTLAGASTLSGLATMTPTEVAIGSGEATETVSAQLVTGNFFDLLGISMSQGRGFRPDEDRLGTPRAVTVLAFDFWQRRYGADPNVVGREIRLNDVPFTIVGIASRDFGSAEPAYGRKLFLPVASLSLLRPHDALVTDLLYKPEICCSDIVARLAPGSTRAQARAEIDALSRTFVRRTDGVPRIVAVTDTAFISRPGRNSAAGGPLIAAALLSAGLILVWLIACATVGNLFLARAAARIREIGIRVSLGASRQRLIRQLLTEGFVVALAASAVGVAISYDLPYLVLRVAGGVNASFPFRVEVDWLVIGFGIAIAVASSVAFALAPALHATRSDVAGALSGRGVLPKSAFPLRSTLLALQVALSVVLLVSASLLARGAQAQAASFDPGFAVNNVSVVTFNLPDAAYDDARRRSFVDDVTSAFESRSGEAAGAFGFGTWEPTFIRRGFPGLVRLPDQPPDRARTVVYLETSLGYLAALGIPIVRGRNFQAGDAARPVAVVNETMARTYWAGQDPIGKTFVVGKSELREVVGLMRDAHTQSMGDVQSLFYVPLRTMRPFPKLLVRNSGSPTEVAKTIANIDPGVRVQVSRLSTELEDRLKEARTAPLLAAVLGGFALFLATIGTFGVFGYVVRQRTREIGIRLTLGAPPGAIVHLMLAGHARAIGAGLVVGALGSVVASSVLRSRLHGLSPFDPLAYAFVAAPLAVAGLAATYLPARRAVRVDPVAALRVE